MSKKKSKAHFEESVKIADIEEQKKQILKDDIIFGIVLVILSSYYMINVAAYSYDYNINFLDAFTGVIPTMTSNPLYGFQGGIAPDAPIFVFLVIAIVILVMVVGYARAINNLINMETGLTGGSSGFEELSTCQEMYMEL